MRLCFAFIIVCLSLVSCSRDNPEGSSMSDQRLEEDLRLVRGKRIYFGHQSVGADIVDGLKDLSSASNGNGWNIVAFPDSPIVPGPFLAHSFVGKNGDPEGKCDAFSAHVEKLLADSVDIAILKFCYADIRHDRDIDRMFDYYRQTMDTLKQKFPHVTFVHVTVPATSRSSWWKRFGRSLLGKDDEWDMGSVRRFEFNRKLTEYYGQEPIFDLAEVESTNPDGTKEEFAYRGKRALELVGDYTYDGGHLNEMGRRRVARALIHTLADIIRGNGI